MPKTILVVEDDPGIRLSVKDELASVGYEVFTADDGHKAVAAARQRTPDLIILDVMLPGLDGYEICKTLRREGSAIPIIMLTVRDKEVDRILGLELGADDYVTKPFSLGELTARVKALLRRTGERPADVTSYSFGTIELDFEKYEAKKKGRRLDLTPLEFQMLRLFIRKKGRVLTRDDFLDGVWGEDNVSVAFRTVDSHIVNLRKKIEDTPARPKHILSVRGVGYKFVD
jgi:two-component system alkaline phosphatase synthesis response regulator PhoP